MNIIVLKVVKEGSLKALYSFTIIRAVMLCMCFVSRLVPGNNMKEIGAV